MNDYKISVITPVYNTEKYLKETFESVKNQTFNFEDIEMIFIDNQSTDSSRDIIEGFSEEYENVKVYETPKGIKGPGPARNIGLDNANGEYIVFLDSDDIMVPEYIETIYDEITHNDVDLVKASFSLNTENGIIPISAGVGRVEVSHDDLSPAMFFNFFEPWCTIYKKSYLYDENIRFIERFNVHESFLFAIESIAKAKNGLILLDDFHGQLWRLRADGTHNTPIKEIDFEYTMHCLSTVLFLLLEQNQPIECIKKISRFILSTWCFDLFVSPEPDEIINAFTFAKGFKVNPDSVDKVFD